ncbi:MAG: sigma-54 dependent transcriptional regulator [Candidatus Cloacimonetes bacterium]|nr:sigma-54 dependent transcriptional regulator [Candidatus Cloacimonadota bacterium]
MDDKPRILVVDDEEDTRDIFKRHLDNYYDVDTAVSAEDALYALENKSYHIVMTDLVMPSMSGLELLPIIKKKYPQIAVIVISGKASIKTAVEAIKNGAEDFIEKPVEDHEIMNLTIDRIMKLHWQSEEIARLRKRLSDDFERSNIVGNSIEIQKLMEKVNLIAPLDTTVMITGETGVGKELFADLIWKNSKRKDKRFVAVNCGSLPETLLESTLFGHKKGSFTDAIRDKIGYFQEANGGTLFLDELTETSPAFQIKLLRVLEKGVIRQVGGDTDISVDVRIITASNKDIESEVKNGNFREDLFYRINVVNLHIPPLRERSGDILLLAQEFTKEHSKKHNKPVIKISEAALSVLINYEWKGNVRELKNAIEHSVIMTRHNIILPEDLPASILNSTAGSNDNTDMRLLHLPYFEARDLFDRKYVEELLTKHKGDVTKAAEASGIKRQNLYDRFNKYNIDPNKYR